jgi:hypothetical protein
MREAPADTVQLIAGLLSHMKQIVGDGAAYAMLHYGAMEEGKRFGAAEAANGLPAVLERIDSILMQESEIVQDTDSLVTVRIHSSALIGTGQRAVHGIVLGLVEGAVTSARKARFKGTVLQAGAPGEITLELRREA